jgi:hypothetical protein
VPEVAGTVNQSAIKCIVCAGLRVSVANYYYPYMISVRLCLKYIVAHSYLVGKAHPTIKSVCIVEESMDIHRNHGYIS